MTGTRKISLAMAVTASLCVAASVSAQTAGGQQALDFGLSAGATWSDNIALDAADPQEGTTGQLGMNLGYSQESRRVQSDIDINAAWVHYFDDEFDDDIIGGLNGSVVLGIVPERFEWLIQDSFGQSRVNVFDAATPDNRQNVNYFTTGPDLTLRFGQATSLKLSGRYSATDYETSGVDGERYNATLALIRQLSSASSLSLNAMGEQFRFDDPIANNEYDLQEAFLRYQIGNSRTTLSADAGYTAIDDEGETSDGALLRVSLRRQISPSASLRANIGSEFSNAGSAFRAAQDQAGVSTDPELVLATADAFERRYALLGWDFARNRTTLGLNAEYSEEAYENVVALDRDIARYAAYFGRQLTPSVRFRIDGRYSSETFSLSGEEGEELHGSTGLTWALGRTLGLTLQYDYRDRTGSGLYVEYTENRASLFLTWSPLAQR